MNTQEEFTQAQIDRIVEMAWEDRTPFEAIEFQFGIKEAQVRKIMRSEMKKKFFQNVERAGFRSKNKTYHIVIRSSL